MSAGVSPFVRLSHVFRMGNLKKNLNLENFQKRLQDKIISNIETKAAVIDRPMYFEMATVCIFFLNI